MKLKEYIEKEGIKPIALATRIGVSQATIYNWINGTFKPNIKFLTIIKKETNNQVLQEDFYDD